MKRFIAVVLALTAVFGTLAVGVSAGNPVDLSFTASYYRIPSDNSNLWHYIPGTEKSDSFPGGTISFFRGYSGFQNGYVYTIKTSAVFSGSSIPGYNSDLSSSLQPIVFSYYNSLLGEDLVASGNLPEVWDVTDPTFSESDYIKVHCYSYNSGRTVNTTYVVQVSNPIFYDTYDLGFGFNWAPFHLPTTTTITYSKFTIEADEAVDESVFYQKNLDALQDLQDAVGAAGTDIVNSVDEMGDQVSGSIDELKQQEALNAATAHSDSQNLQNQLQQDAQQAHQDAVQAHKDAETAHDDALKAPEREKDYISQNAPSSSDEEAFLDALPTELDWNQVSTALSNVYTIMSTTGTVTSLKFPSVTIPYIGKLWDEQHIDFGSWLNNDKIQIVLNLTKVLVTFALLMGILSKILDWVYIAIGIIRGRNSLPDIAPLEGEFGGEVWTDPISGDSYYSDNHVPKGYKKL